MSDVKDILDSVLHDEKLLGSRAFRDKVYTDQPILKRASQIQTPETPQKIKDMKALAYNASGNAIDLIMACNHWARDDGQKAYEAMKILADLSGLDLHACEKDIDISVVEMPSKEELDLIGLSDSPAFCMDQENPSRRVLVSSHPLRDFAREDYRSFKIMVCDKILEAEANLISLRNMAEKYDCCDMIQTLICQIDEQLSTLQKMKLRYTA